MHGQQNIKKKNTNKLLLLHLVGCLFYCTQMMTAKPSKHFGN